MTYATERLAIETYLNTQWAGATAIGFDLHNFTPSANTISLTINNGTVLQGSLGGGTNRIDYVGLVQIQIYTAAGLGSSAWRGYAETLEGIFRNARLTSAGVAVTDPADEFIRFSPRDQHPYIAGTQVEGGLQITTFNAPFTRFELR